MEDMIRLLAAELGQKPQHVGAVVRLLDEGNTIPFIARYRKEQHGAMDDTTLRTLAERLQYLRNLAQRREEIRRSIAAQEKLTDELDAALQAAVTLSELEDLYRPYKPKRRTRATIARERGLAPLAEQLLGQARDLPDPLTLAAGFADPARGVETPEDALAGASDIVAETVSDDAAVRKALRSLMQRQSVLRTQAAKGKEEETSVYQLYYDFRQPVPRLQGHQILAVNRGEREGFLKVTLETDRDQALICVRRCVLVPGGGAAAFLRAACEDAYDRLIAPSMERELRAALTEQANEGAIRNFALNLRPLLMQPPVRGHVTMGLDPGYSHGCKVAVVDPTGKVLDTAVVYPTFSKAKRAEAIETLRRLMDRYEVTHIALGNGTASRETEAMVCELLRQKHGAAYMIVSEAGRLRLFRLAAGGGGISAVRCQPAQRGLHRAAAAGPTGRAGQDRPEGHRRRSVSARRAGKAARRSALRRGGGLRQRRRRRSEHGLPLPAAARGRSERHDGKEHRRLSRGARGLYGAAAGIKGAKARSEGL